MERKLLRILMFFVIVSSVLLALFPILFVFTHSLMSAHEIMSRYTKVIMAENAQDFIANGLHYVRLGILAENPTLEQYRRLLTQYPGYFRMLWNACALVVPILVGQSVIAPLTAYAFEEMRWKYKEVIYYMYLIVMLMPLQILLVPNFIVAGWLGIRGTYLAIILPAIFHPLGVFLVRQQLKSFPKACMEAARLDGASEWGVYKGIVLPNLKSVVAALLVLLFAEHWNMIDQAVVFIDRTYAYPLSVFLGEVASINPGILFALSVFYMIPALLVFLIGQDYLADGISLASLK